MTDNIFFLDKQGRHSVNVAVGSVNYYKIDLSEPLTEMNTTISSVDITVGGNLTLDSSDYDDDSTTLWLNAADCEVGDISKVRIEPTLGTGVMEPITIIAYMVE